MISREKPDMKTSTRRLSRRAFTLVELLVVIGIIALLIGILLPALAAVTGAAKATRTTATMNEFAKACDLFQQQLGFYPGVFPEEDFLGGNFEISGTENALLHLMGGYIELVVNVNDTEYSNVQGVEIIGLTKRIKIYDRNSDGRADALGEGARINGKQYEAFYSPAGEELGVARGQENERIEIPDLLDAWGTPIIYIRRDRRIGDIVRDQFRLDSAVPYTTAFALGEMNARELDESVFNSTGGSSQHNSLNEADWSLLTVVGHQAFMSGTQQSGFTISESRGSYVLISGGEDGVYFSRFDGAGTPNSPADEIPVPAAVGEYDDVVVVGGDAG